MKSLFVILLLAGFSIPSSSFPYVYFFVGENKTWEEAESYCMSEYTALAQINNMENLTAMVKTSQAGYTDKAWIGLYATLVWTWLDGEQPAFTNWFLGHPHDSDNVLCASIVSGVWTSGLCSQKKSSICFNGINYIPVWTALTWMDAKAKCKAQASSLAKIPDLIANAAILATMTAALMPEAWIGLKTTQLWQWSKTSENYAYRNWQLGQPDTVNGGKDCAAIAVKNGTWTDEQCSAQYPFFCYDVYKSRTTVMRMTIQSSTNMENPASSDSLLQQLNATLVKHGVTHFRMTWKKVSVKQTQESVITTSCLLTSL
ncbi:macrophage mannose receptor 1-like isoform X2 [Channa argus]|uniref:macrophage mannose receptor 1-like isoform X2 n=1 Tax=Channa argus TaxID=215402 RepID=UPI00351F9F2D